MATATANPVTSIFAYIVENNLSVSSTEWVQSRQLGRAFKLGKGKTPFNVDRINIIPCLTNAGKKALSLSYKGNPQDIDASHLDATKFNGKGEFSGTLEEFKAIDLSKGGLYFKTVVSTPFGKFPTVDNLTFDESNTIFCTIEQGEDYVSPDGKTSETFVLMQL